MLVFMMSIIGYLIGNRMIQNMSEHFSFSEKNKLKFNYFLAIIILLMMFFLPEMPEKFWFFEFLFLMFIFLTPKILIFIFKMKFKTKIFEFLDLIILEMQSGKNFRYAFKNLIQNETGFIKVQLNEIQNYIIFPEKQIEGCEKFIQRIILEFRDIDRAQTKSLDLIKFLRKAMKQEKEFADKQRQLRESVYIQVGVLLFLYMGLIIFVLSQYEWGLIRNFVLASVGMFLLGLFLILQIGKKKVWKV